jgi:hypothetical protein
LSPKELIKPPVAFDPSSPSAAMANKADLIRVVTERANLDVKQEKLATAFTLYQLSLARLKDDIDCACDQIEDKHKTSLQNRIEAIEAGRYRSITAPADTSDTTATLEQHLPLSLTQRISSDLGLDSLESAHATPTAQLVDEDTHVGIETPVEETAAEPSIVVAPRETPQDQEASPRPKCKQASLDDKAVIQ